MTTQISINLAHALANTGAKVLLIDADLGKVLDNRTAKCYASLTFPLSQQHSTVDHIL